ncbi:MAG TPA: PorV/PorQ family protein [Caldithrix abyssi]|uniref:PorV/PorQ family protein n=1 Tax=Caldithrix abyssi TaxID=187145 RepID=A0A7V5LJP7_CALAY|nr:PorV/PorQ family protein [Caldithrix abyssi]
MRALKFIVFFVLTVIHFLLAQYERPGSSTAQFLKISVSPRASALGDAYIAVVNDAEAVTYNAAALATIEGINVNFNHTEWLAGINHEFFSIAKNFNNQIGAIALSFIGLYTDEMEVRTPLRPEGTGETFFSGNYQIALTYARRLTNHVHFGLTGQYIYMKLYDQFTASVEAINIAVLYKTNFHGFNFGMQISNFGSDITFVNEGYPLPTNFTFGLCFNPVTNDNHQVLVSMAAAKPNDGAPIWSMGLEYEILRMVSLRIGKKFADNLENGIAFGLGIKFMLEEKLFHFDYSFSDYQDLGSISRVGVGFTF